MLKHQNTALLTELGTMKAALKQLTDERQSRRSQNQQITDVFAGITRAWECLETTVSAALSPESLQALLSVGGDPAAAATTNDVKASTGKGDDIETGDVLLNRLLSFYNKDYAPLANGSSGGNAMADVPASLLHRISYVSEGISKCLTTPQPKTAFDYEIYSTASLANKLVEAQKALADAGVEKKALVQVRDEATLNVRRLQRRIDKMVANGSKEGADDEAGNKTADSSRANTPQPASTAAATSGGASSDELANLQTLANSRMERIVAMEKENLELRKRINDKASSAAGGTGGPVVTEHQIKSSSIYSKFANEFLVVSAHLKFAKEKEQYLIERLGDTIGKLEFTEKSLSAIKNSDNAKWCALLGSKDTKIADYEQEIVTLKYRLNQSTELKRQADQAQDAMKDLRNEYEKFREGKIDATKKKSKEGAAKLDKCKSLDEAKALASNFLKEIDSLAASQETLSKSNARLQKQSHEKEEMNNSSMTNVMRLKQLVEVEKESVTAMALQIKEGEQVVLAARLAGTNVKKIEEALATKIREAAATESKLRDETAAVRVEKAAIEGALEEIRLKMSGSAKASEEMKALLDEMTDKVGELSSAKGNLEDELKVKAGEVEKLRASASGMGKAGGAGAYSAELLEVQIKNLRNKVMCNVCNEREKQVMLTRCCHTFCKECIDERIKGRGRNCPSCNDKFDAKEVSRIFLTG
jgi:E3 ubiquitin-protein ligase BRE1